MLQLPQDPNLATTEGSRALVQASARGHINMVQLLLEARADKDLPDQDARKPGCCA